MFWMEELQEIIHFIVINWFDRSGVWIWNWVIVRINRNIWIWNLNITIIYGIMNNFPLIAEITGLSLEGDVLNLNWDAGVWLLHSLGGSFGSSQWSVLNWFIFLQRIGGTKIWTADDACISFMLNSTTEFKNNFLSHADICNNWRRVAASLLLEY